MTVQALFLRTNRVLRLRDTFPETSITLLEVLVKLDAGSYATSADFAADVELLNENWLTADVEALVDGLDMTFPGDYLLTESWERIVRSFYFLENLNAGAVTAITFAAAAMSDSIVASYALARLSPPASPNSARSKKLHSDHESYRPGYSAVMRFAVA